MKPAHQMGSSPPHGRGSQGPPPQGTTVTASTYAVVGASLCLVPRGCFVHVRVPLWCSVCALGCALVFEGV